MTVYLVYISFISFVIMLLIVGSYFISFLIWGKLQRKKIDKKANQIKLTVNKHLQYKDLKDIPEEEIKDIKDIILNKRGLQAFNVYYKEYVNMNGYDDKIKNYIGHIMNHKILMKNHIVRDKYKHSYILYLLAEFRVKTSEIEEFTIKSLDSESLYVRNNALRLIQRIGRVPLVISALEKISTNTRYFNSKIVIDFIDNFEGDKDLLASSLLEIMGNLEARLQIIIINHFTNNENEEEGIRKEILNYFEGSNNKEIILAATKYFSTIIDPRAKQMILNNMGSEDWEIRAISSKAIVEYDSPDSRLKLTENLSDRNFYVRYNSAFSLIDMETENTIVGIANNNPDPFAKEIILYAMHVKQYIDLNEYNKLMTNRNEKVII